MLCKLLLTFEDGFNKVFLQKLAVEYLPVLRGESRVGMKGRERNTFVFKIPQLA
jgi:hypothetical protein